MDPNDKLLASQMGDTGAPLPPGHALSQPRLGPPTAKELEYMLTQMRRRHRKVRASDERDLAEAEREDAPEREKDDIRYRMLWSDVLYRKNVDRLSGRTSSKTRAAEAAVRSHVDMMRDVYGIDIEYPTPLESGDPIPEGGVPIHELERVRPEPVPPEQDPRLAGGSVILHPERGG